MRKETSLIPSPRLAARMAKTAVLLFPPATLLLWGTTALDLWSAAFVVVLVGLLPVLSLAQLPLVDQEDSLPRLPVYLSSAGAILLLGLVGSVLGLRSLGRATMGLGEEPLGRVVALTLVVCLASFALMAFFLFLRKAFGIKESRLLVLLLPKTPLEKAVFVFLSLAAGLGEEVAFRGFLVPALTPFVGGEWAAAALSSMAFGTLHAYQGWIGIFRTAALGFLLAASLLLTGTLWPAILGHAILDVLAGLAFGETLVGE